MKNDLTSNKFKNDLDLLIFCHITLYKIFSDIQNMFMLNSHREKKLQRTLEYEVSYEDYNPNHYNPNSDPD